MGLEADEGVAALGYAFLLVSTILRTRALRQLWDRQGSRYIFRSFIIPNDSSLVLWL